MNSVTVTLDGNLNPFKIGDKVMVNSASGVVSEVILPPLPPIPPGDYFCDSAIASRGTIISGSHESLHVKDGNFLTIQSVLAYGYQYIDLIANFTLPLGTVTGMTLSASEKYSDYMLQYCFLFNYITSKWDQIEARNFFPNMLQTFDLVIPNPSQHISSTGQVQVRFLGFINKPFIGYFDYLKLSVK